MSTRDKDRRKKTLIVAVAVLILIAVVAVLLYYVRDALKRSGRMRKGAEMSRAARLDEYLRLQSDFSASI